MTDQTSSIKGYASYPDNPHYEDCIWWAIFDANGATLMTEHIKLQLCIIELLIYLLTGDHVGSYVKKQRNNVTSYQVGNNVEHLLHYLHVNQEGGIEDLAKQTEKFMPLVEILH